MSKTQPGDLVVIAAVIIMAVFIDIVRGNAEARSRRFAMAKKRRNNIFFSPVSAAARRTLCRCIFSGRKMCRPEQDGWRRPDHRLAGAGHERSGRR
ncbi:hypothetical protein D3Z52_17195, partial [Clostridiaceae bacterium]|nr:hypothetical protein [Clostridiaceae bacterium]